MTKVFCDRCGKELDPECKDQVNIDFNSFGVSGFRDRVRGHTCFQYCVDCAVKIHGELVRQKEEGVE